MIHSVRQRTSRTVSALITAHIRANTRAALQKQLARFSADVKKLGRRYRGRVKTVTRPYRLKGA
jgi:hypothetical protein